MKRNRVKIMVGWGIFCIVFLVVSSWYAVRFNESRLVVPTDLESYVFRIKDLPMILLVLFFIVYVFALFIMLALSIGKSREKIGSTNKTRSLNPKLGIFLPEYLLYRYDHGDQTEEDGE